MSMEDARHFCQQRHGDLVSINSKDENTFLWKQVGVCLFGLLANNSTLIYIERLFTKLLSRS